MLYLGHFSFDTRDDPEFPPVSCGFFTAVVEANNVEEAMKKFEALITEIRRGEDVLERVCQVFLDACVELRALPKSGLLSYYVTYDAERRAMILTSAPGVSEEYAAVYDYVGDEKGAEGHSVPFLVFE
ncbi:MAG TPA: hypothetical protein GX510_10030 [Firmicutes bacterium]|nr:hypothetical protein [Candidatus Fermentithermobacillaceae bacterium]